MLFIAIAHTKGYIYYILANDIDAAKAKARTIDTIAIYGLKTIEEAVGKPKFALVSVKSEMRHGRNPYCLYEATATDDNGDTILDDNGNELRLTQTTDPLAYSDVDERIRRRLRHLGYTPVTVEAQGVLGVLN